MSTMKYVLLVISAAFVGLAVGRAIWMELASSHSVVNSFQVEVGEPSTKLIEAGKVLLPV